MASPSFMVRTTMTAPTATSTQIETIGNQAFLIKTIMPYA
jgi:hypothetical protein